MILQATFTLMTLGWSAISFLRGQRAVAAASATMGAVCALGWWASGTDFVPWLEGGYGMHLLTLIGGYSLGAAVGARVSGRPSPRNAAFAGVALLAAAGVYFFRDAMSGVENAVRYADPRDAQIIVEAGRGEAQRLLQWASALGLAAAALLLVPRRPGTTRLTIGLPQKDDARTPLRKAVA